MEHLKNFLRQIHEVEESILDSYASQWKGFSIPGKQIMTAPGQVERYFYFVTQGLQKSYFLSEGGKEHVMAFAYAPSFSGIPESFFTQTPSRYYLKTITESHFLRIHSDQHQRFMRENREIETLFRKVTERFLDGVLHRQHELMALSMENRYKVFVKRSAHLLHLIPQRDIASYLRIDPTNFSKLINTIPI